MKRYELYTVEQVARKIYLSESYVRTLLQKGRLKGEKKGGVWMTTQEDIKEYLNKKRKSKWDY